MYNPIQADTSRMQRCTECECLGNEYESAVKDHLKILIDTDKALDQPNKALLLELEPLLVEASDRRTKARIALKKHQEIHLQKPGEVSSPE